MLLFSSLPWTSGLKTKEIHMAVHSDEPIRHSEMFLNQPRDPKNFKRNTRKKFSRLMLVFVLGAIPQIMQNYRVALLTLFNRYTKGPQRYNEQTQTYYREKIHPAHAAELSKLATGAWTSKLANEGSTVLLVIVGVILFGLVALKILSLFM